MTQTKVDINQYMEFVDGTTSQPSKNNQEFIHRIQELDKEGVDIARLLTAAIGLSAEGGEFAEIVKKVTFQGKVLTGDTKTHLLRELGDVFWYYSQACMALGFDFDKVVAQNMAKLLARYPTGAFEVTRSENRQAGDL
jgi:NTP pyrophosphatase (non-canonical NTP hydrolase)